MILTILIKFNECNEVEEIKKEMNNLKQDFEYLENQNQFQQNNIKLNNERIDRLYEITERQSLLQVNNSKILSKILSKLESKIIFDWRKDILAYNIQMNELLNQGFKTVYNQLYSHWTTETILLNIKSQCNSNSIICVGGADSHGTLLLVSCGSCLDILTTSVTNQPRLVNGAWWYFTPPYSFGFAPNSNIKQNNADDHDCHGGYLIGCTDSKRLSWNLGSTNSRLGKCLKSNLVYS
jgi:hypothetical protein